MLYRCIYRLADRVIVHTPAIRRRLIEEFGVKEPRIVLVKHGVYEAPDDPRIDRKRAREELGVGDADRVVLFFGYIREYKGLDVLLPSFARCRAELPGLKLIIAGSVCGEYRPVLDRLLARANLGEALAAKLGYVSDREAELLFKAADVVVLPYAEASQSGVLFLSYAYGRPVIVSNIGSFPEDVVEGRTGYVFRVGDSDDLARTIARFFADLAPRRDEAEREIKAFAAANYSWAASARELLAVYRALASR
jgi:glycosyltransferase involved in cell wall biosynthesis